jgi:XTP/dITP diphosphohydrolase
MTTAQKPQTAAPPILVVGTNNRKKGAELVELVAPLGVEVRTLADFDNSIDVDETGRSFAENAVLKATQQAVKLNAWVLGDDSGIAVDALGGAPGIYSARFAGPNATDEDNRRHLLEKLQGVEWPKRTARFVCHLVLADPAGTVRAESTGEVHGIVRFEEAGTNGFGYDPLFEIVEYHRTFGEIGPAAKSCLSHRARAVQAMVPKIAALVASGEWHARG